MECHLTGSVLFSFQMESRDKTSNELQAKFGVTDFEREEADGRFLRLRRFLISLGSSADRFCSILCSENAGGEAG
jgi:hypothetical protein